jgi:hypothetical protein
MGDVCSSVCTFCVPLWPEASLSVQLGCSLSVDSPSWLSATISVCCQLSSPKVVYIFQLDDGLTTETCSYVYISNILTYDSRVA